MSEPSPLDVPRYEPSPQRRIFFALESFARHMTDEGNQLQLGMQAAGYELWGSGYPPPRDDVDVAAVLERTSPSVAIVQDKREWDSSRPSCLLNGRDFVGVECLADRPGIFRVGILKDAHADPAYTRDSLAEFSPHAIIAYYHERCVLRDAPYVQNIPLIRTYHSLDRDAVPAYSPENRRPWVVSGALGTKFYPLRRRFSSLAKSGFIPDGDRHRHPGYHGRGSQTPDFLKMLSGYKVAICTSSVKQYALRKIIEATACGCCVVTDLPEWDCLPGIDGNLVRVSPDATDDDLRWLVNSLVSRYNPEFQSLMAAEAIRAYDFRVQCRKVADDIEDLRSTWKWNRSIQN